MDTRIVTCDQCKQRVEHGFHLSEIHFGGYTVPLGGDSRWDFCSVACLSAFVASPPRRWATTHPDGRGE